MLWFVALTCVWSLDLKRPPFIKHKYQEATDVILKQLNVSVSLYQNVARTTFALKYFNSMEKPLEEADLVFPHDTSMAITDLTMKCDGKIFVSHALEASSAQAEYDQKKDEKQTALLVKRSGDFLEISLATIPPKTEVIISFTAASVVPTVFAGKDERWYSHYVLPMTFVPRYTPRHQDIATVASPVTSGPTSSYNFSFAFSALDAASVECPSHPSANIDESQKTITFSGKVDRDLVVNAYHASIPSPIVESFGNSQVTQFMIEGRSLPVVDSQQKKSIVFLLDRSGSMGYGDGSHIWHLRQAMSTIIHSLHIGLEFDIVGFGSSWKSLFGKLVPYDDDTMAQAEKYIDGIASDYGGTEIMQPLRAILNDMKPDIVFLITDGAVSNTGEILKFVKEHNTVISTLGIGNAASVDLVRGIAEETGGVHEFVDDGSKIEETVIRFLQDSLNPALRSVTVSVEGGQIIGRVPKAITRNSIVSIGILSAKGQVPQLTLKGQTMNEEEFKHVYVADGTRLIGGKSLHCLLVLSGIASETLEKATAIEMAKALNLMTKYTSLVLYDDTVQYEDVQNVTVHIPVPSFHHTMGTFAYAKAMPMRSFDGGHHRVHSAVVFDSVDHVEMAEEAAVEEKPQKKEAPVQALTKLQKANGSWNSLKSVVDIVKCETVSSKWTDEQAATAIALQYLKRDPNKVEVVKKAMNWLKNNMTQENVEEILAWAAEVLAKK